MIDVDSLFKIFLNFFVAHNSFNLCKHMIRNLHLSGFFTILHVFETLNIQMLQLLTSSISKL